MTIEVEVSIKLAYNNVAELDYARLESAVHRGLQEDQLPVIDVAVDGVRPVDEYQPQTALGPFGEQPVPLPGAPPPSLPRGPFGPQV